MSKIIKIECTGTKLLSISSLVSLQGNLKEKTKEQLSKLKSSIIEYGFSFPIFVWENNGKNYTIDGHGRDYICKQLIAEGYLFEDKDGKQDNTIPINYIYAKDKKEAKEKLLMLNSQFGNITDEGLYEFINEPGNEIEFEEIKDKLEFNDIDLDYFDVNYISDRVYSDGEIKEKEVDENIETKNECPKCHYRW